MPFVQGVFCMKETFFANPCKKMRYGDIFFTEKGCICGCENQRMAMLWFLSYSINLEILNYDEKHCKMSAGRDVVWPGKL